MRRVEAVNVIEYDAGGCAVVIEIIVTGKGARSTLDFRREGDRYDFCLFCRMLGFEDPPEEIEDLVGRKLRFLERMI